MRFRSPWPALALALLALGTTSGRPIVEEAPASVSGDRPTLVFLAPGTPIEPGPPPGWTHRVVRSVPRLATGDLGGLPDSAAETATLLRTVILAEVRRDGPSFTLARVGVGNAVPTGGVEVVATPDGPPDVLATLSLVERLVLQVATAELGRGRLVAGTPTFALFRTPSVLVVEGRHEAVELSYALLVDPPTGALTTLCWATPADRPVPPRALTVLRLAPSFDAALDVRVTRRVGPLPVAWSFALRALPPGRPVALPPDLGPRLADPSDPEALEGSLRRLLG